MNRPMTLDPEPLYDKPHSVDLAQVMMVFQYFMVVSVSIGVVPRILSWVGVQPADLPFLSGLDGTVHFGPSYPLSVVLPVLVVLTIPYIIVVLDLGLGRRWARAIALLVAPVNTVIGIEAVYSSYGAVPALVVAPVWIGVALCVIGGLLSRAGRQWVRQRGWEPWYQRYAMDQVRRRRRRRPRRRR